MLFIYILHQISDTIYDSRQVLKTVMVNSTLFFAMELGMNYKTFLSQFVMEFVYHARLLQRLNSTIYVMHFNSDGT